MRTLGSHPRAALAAGLLCLAAAAAAHITAANPSRARNDSLASLLAAFSSPSDARRLWDVAFEDDFDGPAGQAPNPQYWTVADNPGLSGNKELEYYSPANVYLSGNSSLVLASFPQVLKGFNYTSGWVDTQGKVSRQFGRWEIRAKLPGGQGIWPAHWLMPQGGQCWPTSGEIDILEAIDGEWRVHGALHWSSNRSVCGDADEQNGGGWSDYLPYDPAGDFHVYGVLWSQFDDALYYYVDELVYTNVTAVSEKFNQSESFYIILNTAVGGSWPGAPNATTVWPQHHLIDWVRWYTPAAAA